MRPHGAFMSCRPTLFHHSRALPRHSCVLVSERERGGGGGEEGREQHHGERHPRTLDDHTLECNVRSERVKGSDLDVRPLRNRQMCERVRLCVHGLGCRQGQGMPLPRTHAHARVRCGVRARPHACAESRASPVAHGASHEQKSRVSMHDTRRASTGGT